MSQYDNIRLNDKPKATQKNEFIVQDYLSYIYRLTFLSCLNND